MTTTLEHRAPADSVRRFVTTAIPYVNARPHVGFAYELVLADTLARYLRSVGEEIRFQTGTDENSLKNVRAAQEEGVPTAEFVERNAGAFRSLTRALGLAADDFIRTSSDARHPPGVNALWSACEASGDIYKCAYEGLYCVGCEQFYDEAELQEGLCPEHRTPLEPVAEQNYFFRLTRYADALIERIESGALRIEPSSARREITSFLRSGLRDISISRSKERAGGWGIPVPGDGGQVIYVWFDALGNYLSALDYGGDEVAFERWWAAADERIHVIGKGITRFHAVYWPAILLSAGLRLPDTLWVHGYLTQNGAKISKSGGAATLDPETLAERYGADTLRYYLLRHIRPHQDSDFSEDALAHAHDRELADQLGNLVSRTLALLERHREGRVPARGGLGAHEAAPVAIGRGLASRVSRAFDELRPDRALSEVWKLVEATNRYLELTEPWHLARAESQGGTGGRAAARQLDTVLYCALESIRLLSHYLRPFIPATADRLARVFDGAELVGANSEQWGVLKAGATLVGEGSKRLILFPKERADKNSRGGH